MAINTKQPPAGMVSIAIVGALQEANKCLRFPKQTRKLELFFGWVKIFMAAPPMTIVASPTMHVVPLENMPISGSRRDPNQNAPPR